jgi:glucosamine--fructose-6-phosphate aminotransferase (isomerizing)
VGTAGLITKESAHFPAEGMSAAAFRHGPFELVDGRMFLLVFEGDPRTAELNHRLARDVKAAGGRAAVVCESGEPGLFHTPPVPPRLRPVSEILPVEMITLALAARAGHAPGVFSRAAKITLSE